VVVVGGIVVVDVVEVDVEVVVDVVELQFTCSFTTALVNTREVEHIQDVVMDCPTYVKLVAIILPSSHSFPLQEAGKDKACIV
jgi:hypothetical protein